MLHQICGIYDFFCKIFLDLLSFPLENAKKLRRENIMYVDKTKMEVVKVEVKTRENASITYKIKNFKTIIKN